jgi:amidophosphoribosyltransferase
MCGILGIIGEDDVVSDLYEGLIAIQHRGQDAAGIMTYDEVFHLRKGLGLVADVFDPEALESLPGNAGIAHVRYPTVGLGGEEDAQPFFVTSPHAISMAHNGNVTNFLELREQFAAQGKGIASQCDVEVILRVFEQAFAAADPALVAVDRVAEAVAAVFREVKGSYSVVALLADTGLVAFRDPFGIKPCIMGRRKTSGKDAVAVASESVALDLLGFGNVRDLAPGEMLLVDLDRNEHFRQIAPANGHPCIFEYVYFARPDSFIDKVSVYKTRLRLGESLAAEHQRSGLPVPDVVIPVPDSARTAATTLARALGVNYREGLVKNRYIGRTFIMPGQKARQASVKRKLNSIRVEFEGKHVLIVDDSIVRGTTSRKIVQMARDAGARIVGFASYSPPLQHPCVYGIDMQTTDEFVARNRSNAEICKFIGADYLLYGTIDDLETAAGAGNTDIAHFCTACFTGHYPTGDVTAHCLGSIAEERRGSRLAISEGR